MIYRKVLNTTEEMAEWYDKKYTDMGGVWYTPPSDCNQHLDDLGVPFDQELSLLDIGCGGGHFLHEASKRVRAWGLEVSDAALQYAREYLPKDPPPNLWKYSIEGFEKINPTPWDFITSIGSLEHIIDIDAALDSVRALLKPTGQWYFYNPNEKWIHEDQPNERTATSEEWRALIESHGLVCEWERQWGDCTAFRGRKA